MSKFQTEYIIAHQSFEDFILVIYVLVDDLYKKVAPNQVKYRPNVDKALFNRPLRRIGRSRFRKCMVFFRQEKLPTSFSENV